MITYNMVVNDSKIRKLKIELQQINDYIKDNADHLLYCEKSYGETVVRLNNAIDEHRLLTQKLNEILEVEK